MKHGIWIGRIPAETKSAWAHMPFVGRIGLAHYWTRNGAGIVQTLCGLSAVETHYAGLIQAEGADRCKNCQRRVKP
ncbi:hypothetical protein JFK97_06700 [Chromobacterium phragmitis]|uniref:hypothetical protein n=1 Tax=Chromobacterium amazonense TaxID=1382803 RepID=UPI0021B80CC7|nr:hypothetical protein [Chromobacterium amazonense]MBM2884076.1 hypothetical protein [Chromobacterium amazonense]